VRSSEFRLFGLDVDMRSSLRVPLPVRISLQKSAYREEGFKCSTSVFARQGLFQGEWVFGFDSAEFADRKSAARVVLQVFDVGSCTCAGLFQRLHRAVAVFAAHRLATFGESFV
jgi:hypothetical protein